jgi:hypothetical protein
MKKTQNNHDREGVCIIIQNQADLQHVYHNILLVSLDKLDFLLLCYIVDELLHIIQYVYIV